MNFIGFSGRDKSGKSTILKSLSEGIEKGVEFKKFKFFFEKVKN